MGITEINYEWDKRGIFRDTGHAELFSSWNNPKTSLKVTKDVTIKQFRYVFRIIYVPMLCSCWYTVSYWLKMQMFFYPYMFLVSLMMAT